MDYSFYTDLYRNLSDNKVLHMHIPYIGYPEFSINFLDSSG